MAYPSVFTGLSDMPTQIDENQPSITRLLFKLTHLNKIYEISQPAGVSLAKLSKMVINPLILVSWRLISRYKEKNRSFYSFCNR